jgi:hypothetical protein
MYLTNFFFWRTVLIKNKLFTTGIAALTLVFAIVIMGCDNPTTQVEGTVDLTKAPAPGKPTVSSSDSGTGTGINHTHQYTVSWTAADNGIDYTLYVRQNGKKTVQQISSSSYSLISAELDLWRATVTVSASSHAIVQTAQIQIGVQTDSATAMLPSDIVWSDAVSF